MDKQIIIRVDAGLKTRLYKVARQEGKATSQVLRELIEEYVTEHDFESHIDDLWKRIGKKLKQRGKTVADVEAAIRYVRKQK